VNEQRLQPGERVVLSESLPGRDDDLGSVVEIEEGGTVVVEWTRSGEQARFNPGALERWVEPDE
jgi:hypothetical protein